ncbi:hypothetical protein BR93DRAFT_344234 [Coniochaeta sp. PMI_546]|nr:hypothetical protein BR93DRAFT_344234 [Coniochaeta sp. PMI_546]
MPPTPVHFSTVANDQVRILLFTNQKLVCHRMGRAGNAPSHSHPTKTRAFAFTTLSTSFLNGEIFFFRSHPHLGILLPPFCSTQTNPAMWSCIKTSVLVPFLHVFSSRSHEGCTGHSGCPGRILLPCNLASLSLSLSPAPASSLHVNLVPRSLGSWWRTMPAASI